MDILISSNLERLVFELMGRDAAAVSAMMQRLKEEGRFDIPKAMQAALDADFYADWCDEDETAQTIRRTFEQKNYLPDTHTAVAMGVFEKYKKLGDRTKTVIVSTASPYKFPEDVLCCLGVQAEGLTGFDAARRLSELTGLSLPLKIAALETKPVRHTGVYEKDALQKAVLGVI